MVTHTRWLVATRAAAIKDWSCCESIRRKSITTTLSCFSSTTRSSSLSCTWSPLTTIVSSMSYDKELAAAKKAATLAARLCQVRHSPISSFCNPKTTTIDFLLVLYGLLCWFRKCRRLFCNLMFTLNQTKVPSLLLIMVRNAFISLVFSFKHSYRSLFLLLLWLVYYAQAFRILVMVLMLEV